MKYMVCNCNSYGNIDYKKPLLFKSDDYRTSSNLALKYIPFGDQKFYGYERPVSKYERDPLLESEADRLKTTYTRTYDRKYIKYEDKFQQAPLLPKTHYLRTLKDKMFKDPPVPRKFTIPEYKDEYYRKEVAVDDKTRDLKARAICNVTTIGRGEQLRIKLEDTGVMKHLDPYVSTVQMSYYPYTKADRNKSQRQVLTFYNYKKFPEVMRVKITKPINDEMVFNKPIKDRFVPTPVYRVPFSGKTTSYESTYVHPTRGCLYTEALNHGVEFLQSYPKASHFETLAAPNMYCTESCHLGTGKPVKTAVFVKKRTYRHDYCK